MNKDTLKGSWKEIQGKIKAKWGKLTDNDLTEIEGSAEALSGKIQKNYGMTKEKATEAASEFWKSCDRDKKSRIA